MNTLRGNNLILPTGGGGGPTDPLTHNDIIDFDDAVEDVVAALDITSAVVGTIITHPEQPSEDWLECIGQEISETTYSALYGVLGSLYPPPVFRPRTSITGVTGIIQHIFCLPDNSGLVFSNATPRIYRTANIIDTAAVAANIAGITGSLGGCLGAARNPGNGTICAYYSGGTASILIRSTDNGATWLAATTPPISNNKQTEIIWVDNGTTYGRFLVAGRYTPNTSLGCALQYSDDDGDTWQMGAAFPTSGSDASVFGLAVSGSVMVASTQSSLDAPAYKNTRYWKSTDYGVNWVYLGTIIHPDRSGSGRYFHLSSAGEYFQLTSRAGSGWDPAEDKDAYASPFWIMHRDETAFYPPLLPDFFAGEFPNSTTGDGINKFPPWGVLGDRLCTISFRGVMSIRGDGAYPRMAYNFNTAGITNNFYSKMDINQDGFFIAINGNSVPVGRLYFNYPQNSPGKFYIPNESQPHARRWIKAQ